MAGFDGFLKLDGIDGGLSPLTELLTARRETHFGRMTHDC
jgi:hypothetical protein